MNTEDYVSLEVAKLLKEKGFDEYCENVYKEDCKVSLKTAFRTNKDLPKTYYSKPTLYEAQK